MLQTLGPNEIRCFICRKNFSNKQHLRDHIKGRHLCKNGHHCAKCNKFLTDAYSLKDHNKTRYPKTLKFEHPQCKKTFPRSPNLLNTCKLMVKGSISANVVEPKPSNILKEWGSMSPPVRRIMTMRVHLCVGYVERSTVTKRGMKTCSCRNIVLHHVNVVAACCSGKMCRNSRWTVIMCGHIICLIWQK